MGRGGIEHGRAKHLVGPGDGRAKERVEKAALAVLLVVDAELGECAQGNVTKRLGPVCVEAARSQAVARELLERGECLFLAGNVCAGGRLRPCGQRASQGDDRLIEAEVNVGADELLGETVPGGVVPEPALCVAVDLWLKDAVLLPQRLDLAKAVLGAAGADAAEKLVEQHEHEGEARGQDLARAYVRAPREVAAQVPVAHGLVRGEVVVERGVALDAVLVLLHEAGLLVEELLVGANATGLGACHGAHLADLVRQVALHLGAAAQDGLVHERAALEQLALLCTGAGQDGVNDALDVRSHDASSPAAIGTAS